MEITLPRPCDADLLGLADCLYLKRLRVEREERPCDAGFAVLAKFKQLEFLNLDLRSPLSPAEMKGIAAASSLRNLSVRFYPRERGELIRQRWVDLRGLRQLEGLSVENTTIDDEFVSHLRGLTTLKYLHLSEQLCLGGNWNVPGTSITNRGLRHLASLTNLTRLNLVRSRIDDKGLKLLAPLTSLEWLA